jgi:hypothetical protein
VKRVLEASPRWNRQRLAVLEAVDFDLRRMFSVLYLFSATCAAIYITGWLRFNLMDLPVGPMSLHTVFSVCLTAIAGVLYALLLPATLLSLLVERALQRRMRLLDQKKGAAAKHRLIAMQALPSLQEAMGGTHGQHHHQKP